MSIPVGVLGASGFLGGELLRLLVGHPAFELEYVAAGERGGDGGATERPRPVVERHPSLRGVRGGGTSRPLATRPFDEVDVAVVADRCEAAFLATPPDVAAELAPRLLDAGVEVVIDLSPAHRLRDAQAHERWYPSAVRDQDTAAAAVYGLPELNRERLRDARMIASPGCFATAIILALLPLRALEGIGFDCVTVDGKTGSTGAGGALRRAGMHALRSSVVSPYRLVGHRHAPEVVQALIEHGVARKDAPPRLGVSAYGVDAVRGLSASAYVFCDGPVDERTVRRALHQTYRAEQFVRVQSAGDALMPLPDPKATLGSNFCDVGVGVDEQIRQIVLIGVLDNLVKGGAGQAIQACNVRYGLPEDAGLEHAPVFPA